MRSASATRSSIPRGLIPALVTVALLAIPLVAMQFTREVQWDGFDFIVMGALLFGSGFGLEWLLRRGNSRVYRFAAALAVLSALLMTWGNMAVGLLGGEGHPQNAWLLTVPALGIAGAIAARLRPAGMAWTLVAMAVLQAALTVVALVAGWKPLRHGAIEVWAPNAMFVLLFLAAAVLFSVAAEEPVRATAAAQPRARPLRRALQALALLGIGMAIGAAGFYVGQIDDAPGAGVLGAVVIVASAVTAWQVFRRP